MVVPSLNAGEIVALETVKLPRLLSVANGAATVVEYVTVPTLVSAEPSDAFTFV